MTVARFFLRRLDYKIGKCFSLLCAGHNSVIREINLDVFKKPSHLS